jgi:hypothetical protein
MAVGIRFERIESSAWDGRGRRMKPVGEAFCSIGRLNEKV